jgi:hypothetical protein
VKSIALQFEFAGVHADVVVLGVEVTDVCLASYGAFIGVCVVDVGWKFFIVG